MDTVDSNGASAKDADADAAAEDSGDADEELQTTPSLQSERAKLLQEANQQQSRIDYDAVYIEPIAP